MPSRVDANITVKFFPTHGDAVTLKIASFEIWSDKCIFYTRQAEPVLEHVFHHDNDRIPISYGAFEVTFIHMVEIRYRDAKHRTRPRYKFEDEDLFAYKSFHSKFAGRLFVSDVATASVTGPRGIKTRDECMKLWQTGPTSSIGMITVPLQVGNGDMQLYVIESRWIQTRKRAGSKGMHLQLHREKPAKKPGLFTLASKRSSQSSQTMIAPAQHPDEELSALLAHFDQLSIEVSTKQGCDELEAFLRRCLDKDLSDHGNSSHGDRVPTPDPRQPRPELLRNARFYHQRLRGDNIRLLKIHHGRGQEPISIDLHTISLRSASTYEALSYCWAAWSVPAQEKAVTVNGEPDFFMSAHLWNALRRLRSRNTSRYLWIDAFCINQGDEEERTQQISLMGQIYQKARRTIIWISEFNDTDLKDTCKRIGAASGDADAEEATLCAPTPAAAVAHFNDFHQLRQYMAPLYEREELTNAGKVWWKRLWCVQEFFFSQEQQSVYIAQHALTWDQFLDLMDSVRKDTVGRGPVHKDDDPLVLFRELRDKGKSEAQEGFGLHYLLRQTGKFHCGMPCDRIYALLGMTSMAREYITPDTRDIDRQVFENATMYLIREARSLNALMDERLDRRRNTAYGSGDIGTWVPDFTCLSTPEPEARQLDHQAGKGWPDVRLISNEDPRMPSMLRIGAVSFDRIRTRTTQAQLPRYESSPSGSLIYPDLQQPGRLVVELLRILDDPRVSHFQYSEEFELGRTPHVGLLILDYLFDGRRTVHGELKRRRGRAETNLEDFYREELAADLDHVRKEGSYEDRQFVQAHWQRKLGYLNGNDVDISRAVDVHAWPWDDLIASTDGNRSYQELTFDFENLFLYARAGGQYHFFGDKFEIPLRAGLLECRDDAAMRQKLPMDYRHRNEDIEIHPYTRKARDRDFFRTEHGFLGLGPASLEVGDLIVVPFGCAHPLILRERAQPRTAKLEYELVGEATIPCIMDAEWTSDPEEVETFDIA